MSTAVLPYLASPGSIVTVFERIKKAATPDRVTGDVVANAYQMKGGAGRSILPYLKRMNFLGSDGVPTDLYKRFRNENTSGQAVAEAILHGYGPLKQLNERFYELSDPELKALIIQLTGAASTSPSVQQTLGTLKKVMAYADFKTLPSKEALADDDQETRILLNNPESVRPTRPNTEQSLGLNLSYTINLNLPATADQAVFNAIFRSLREHLLSDQNA